MRSPRQVALPQGGIMYGSRDINTCAIPTCDPGGGQTPMRERHLTGEKNFFEKILAQRQASLLFPHFLIILYHKTGKMSNFGKLTSGFKVRYGKIP